jgi:hypothetical protein
LYDGVKKQSTLRSVQARIVARIDPRAPARRPRLGRPLNTCAIARSMGASESRPDLLRRAVNRCTSSRTPDLDENLQQRLATLTFDASLCDAVMSSLWVRLTDNDWLHSWKALALTRSLLLNGHQRCVSRCVTPEWHELLLEMANGLQ